MSAASCCHCLLDRKPGCSAPKYVLSILVCQHKKVVGFMHVECRQPVWLWQMEPIRTPWLRRASLKIHFNPLAVIWNPLPANCSRIQARLSPQGKYFWLNALTKLTTLAFAAGNYNRVPGESSESGESAAQKEPLNKPFRTQLQQAL